MDSDPTLSLHSLRSRNFTKQESTRITALFHVLASSLLRESLLSGYAMPPADKNGAVGVGVLPSSDGTMALITPYGTLLLLLKDELDAFSAELVMNFTKGFMGGPVNMDNPISSDQADASRIGQLEEEEKLLYTLREIAETSEDAESVRVAFIALTTTDVGQAYLRGNPIKL